MSGLIIPYGDTLPRIADGAFVAPTATVIGDVEIGNGSSIWFGVVVRGDVNRIRIGENTNIQDLTVIHVASDRLGQMGGFPAIIGSSVTVGHGAIIHACTLEDECFVGMGATVMDGAVVESRAMVAAGALVTAGKHVHEGQLWAGVPAKHLRDLSPGEIEHNGKTAPQYTLLAQQYMNAAT